jgi:glycosyltransferase involved in cell wall biosynthesis
MVNVESMLLGTPLVTFGIGGSAEFIRPGVNGLLVEEYTPEALALSLQSLVTNTTLRHELGENARRFAVKSFAGLRARYENLYHWVKRTAQNTGQKKARG